MKRIFLAVAFAGCVSAASVGQTPAAPQATGKVTKIDAAAGKITIDSGPIRNLDMPAMTMAFRAGEASMLTHVKPGDRVVFTADKVNGQYTVLTLEKAK
jgi:Cu/Ag efflux protein CusF